MKKVFLVMAGIGLATSFFTESNANNPNKLTDDQIVELLNNMNNELMTKDIPALEDKIVVVDLQGNVLLEETLAELEMKAPTSEEKRIINRSSFLMEYAGDSYYILER